MNREIAEKIIDCIIYDMTTRRGFRQNWDAFEDIREKVRL